MRILALIADRPTPPIGGARVRNYYLWPALQALGVEVQVLGYDVSPGPASAPASGPPGVPGEFFTRERQSLPARAWNAARHSYHVWPRSQALAARVDALAAAWRPEVIHAEELRMGFYLPRSRSQAFRAAQTLTLHNVESGLHRRLGSAPISAAAALINRLHQRSLETYERRMISLVDRAFAFSPADLERYRALYPRANWALTRNGAQARPLRPPPQVAAAKLLFVGSLSWTPNVRGLFWLLDQVLPRLAPGVALTVAGSGAGPELRRRLAAAGAVLLDTPADLTPVYAAHALCIAPLFEGSGTRGKILEACAYERLVVTTSLGLEGLDLRPGIEGVVLADNAESFAGELRRWLADTESRARLAQAGRQAVLARYDWSVVAAELLQHWRELVRLKQAARHLL